ncbi:MAG: HAD-IA family hydrolase [Actinomycetota bacterium]
MSRFGAVIFDLFGTLVYEFPRADWDRWFVRSAEALGIDAVAFRREWEATSVQRQTGRLGDAEANIRELCRRVGVDPSPDQVAAALEVRMVMYKRWFVPTPGTIDTLRWLRARRVPTALISQCAPDTPPLWRASPLAELVDVEVFSSEVGLRKPDPAIYLHACRGLGVAPDVCLYIGDGSYSELSGAKAVGMTAVLVLDPEVEPGGIARSEADEWTGERITSIAEVPGLL